MKYLLMLLVPLLFNQPSVADDVKMDLKNFRHRLEMAREHVIIAATCTDLAFTESTKEEGKYIMSHFDPKPFASLMNVTLMPALNDIDDAVVQAGGKGITLDEMKTIVEKARNAN